MSSKGDCHRCGRDTHWVSKCYAVKHKDGSKITTKAPAKRS